MLKSYKYRLYPTRKQRESLTVQLEGHRLLYNIALAERKEFYEKESKGMTYSSQATRLLPEIKKGNDSISACNYSSLQQTLRRLDKSFKAFFRRIKSGEKPGYPRFKSKDRFNTISYAVLGDGCQIKNGMLYIQNAGYIKVKWHREITGNIKTLSVTKRNDRWYVSFAAQSKPKPLPETGKQIGIDLGLEKLAMFSDGNGYEPDKFFRKSEEKLKKAQQRVARRKKGSARRRKARTLVAKIHEKIANQRLDSYHKKAKELVENYDGFVVENLNIKGMVKNKHLSKSIHDAAWSMFLSILKFKAESAGREFIKVNPRNTSQICSDCGHAVKKSLNVRVHKCPYCGLVLDRDVNAAINIMARTGPSALA